MSNSRRDFLIGASFLAMMAMASDVQAGWNGCSAGFCNVAASGPAANWSLVQSKTDTAGSGTTRSFSLTSPVTSGNILVGATLLVTSALLISVTDDKGNPYVLTNSGYLSAGSTNTVCGFRSQGPLTNSPQTLTLTYQSSSVVWVVVDEFNAGITLSGISLDGSQLVVDTPSPSPVFQTVQTNDLQYCAVFSTSGITSGAGWTTAQGSGAQQFSEWKQVASPGSANTGAYTTSGDAWSTVFGVSATPRTSWELRQNQLQRTANTTTTGTLTFPKTVASGSIVIGSVAVGILSGGIADITSIVDDKGNNYTIVSPNTGQRAIFWSNGTLTNGPQTITVTCNATEEIIYVLCNEFLPPTGTTTYVTDGTATGQTGSNPYTSTSITTTHNGDLIYSFSDAASSGSTPNNAFSALNGVGQTWCDAFLIQQTAGSVSSRWLANSSPGCCIAAFKAT